MPNFSIRRVLAFVVILSMGLIGVPASAGQRASRPLFEAQGGARQAARTNGVMPRRARAVRVRLDHLPGTAGSGLRDAVLLNLFDDVQLTAWGTSIERPRSTAFIWHGRIRDAGHEGQVTLAVTDGVVAGTIFSGDRTFEIGYVGDGNHEIREIEAAAFPTDDPGFDASPDPETSPPEGLTPESDSATQIDVMVVWTPNARVAAGGTSAMQSLVALSVANANTAYGNSQIGTRLRLVHAGEVAFTESTADIAGDLGRLASTSDGSIDQVHTLRAQYGADIVTLMGAGYTSGGACGLGYLMGTPTTSFAPWAFNVVDYACAAGNLTYAHEVGHNQGLHHDPVNASGPACYAYAYGYQDPGGAFRTVMAYGGAPRVMHFSNPSVSYGGRTTGVPDAQDNARALNGSAGSVANFRQSVVGGCTYSVSHESLSFSSSGGVQSISVTTGAECAWTAASSAGWLGIGASSGRGPGSLSVTAAENSGPARSASITIAGHTVTIRQSQPPCTFSVTPTAMAFAAAGGSAVVTVSTGAWCSWTTTNGVEWLGIGAAGGMGGGSLTVTAARNRSDARTAQIVIAGVGVTVTQDARVKSGHARRHPPTPRARTDVPAKPALWRSVHGPQRD